MIILLVLYQYSCLGNPIDSGAWWGSDPGVVKKSDMTEWQNSNIISLFLIYFIHNSLWFFFLNSVQILVVCFIYLFICGCMAYKILVPWPGIEHKSSACTCGVFTTGLPGNSQYFVPLILFHQSCPLIHPPTCW